MYHQETHFIIFTAYYKLVKHFIAALPNFFHQCGIGLKHNLEYVNGYWLNCTFAMPYLTLIESPMYKVLFFMSQLKRFIKACAKIKARIHFIQVRSSKDFSLPFQSSVSFCGNKIKHFHTALKSQIL